MAPLTDGHNRRIDYLRLSVTDRCDLRCRYCIPDNFCDFAPRGDLLDPGEIERVVRAFATLGVHRVRLTGGEPLVRRDVAEIARRISAIKGVNDLSLSTNGTRLAHLAPALRNAGVGRLNVSLDSLSPEHFRQITGRDALKDVLAGLDAARAAGFDPIKINMVVMPETRDEEIEAAIEFSRARGFVLRFIETMPVGAAGRKAGFRELQPLIERIAIRFGLLPGIVPGGGPARYLVAPEGGFSVGFITALSQHFCASCNRVRLSADGRLQLCLGDEAALDLRSLLRSGASGADLSRAIVQAIQAKPWMHEFREAPEKIIRIMAQTGG